MTKPARAGVGVAGESVALMDDAGGC